MPRYGEFDFDDDEPRSTSRYSDIWHESVEDSLVDRIHDRTGYSEREIIQAHLEVFLEIPGLTETPRGERYELWEDYIDAMVNGGLSRADFFAELGIDEGDFNWTAWREAMGY